MNVTAFVLDASVAATWLLPDQSTEQSDRVFARLRSHAVLAHAPELWLWECGNVIANAVKRRRIAVKNALLAWSVLDAVRSRVEIAVLEPSQARACLVLGIDNGLSIYDSAYLWLAMSLGLPLLTHDQRLADAARSCTVAAIGAHDVS
jgi:predicted nucleic acid-binding protein